MLTQEKPGSFRPVRKAVRVCLPKNIVPGIKRALHHRGALQTAISIFHAGQILAAHPTRCRESPRFGIPALIVGFVCIHHSHCGSIVVAIPPGYGSSGSMWRDCTVRPALQQQHGNGFSTCGGSVVSSAAIPDLFYVITP